MKSSHHPFRFVSSAKKPWNDSGYSVRKGRTYRFTARVKDGPEPYMDDKLPCTPDGPATIFGRIFAFVARDARFPLNPVRLIGPGKIKRLRVLRDCKGWRASFLTLIAAIGRDDCRENVYVIGSRREFQAHADGELVFFSNDWPGGPGTEGEARFECSGSYGNNHGELEIEIEEL